MCVCVCVFVHERAMICREEEDGEEGVEDEEAERRRAALVGLSLAEMRRRARTSQKPQHKIFEKFCDRMTVV